MEKALARAWTKSGGGFVGTHMWKHSRAAVPEGSGSGIAAVGGAAAGAGVDFLDGVSMAQPLVELLDSHEIACFLHPAAICFNHGASDVGVDSR